ncbi:hypothetical protein IVA88_01435 [Bradyrhizobium sp. 149]|uniref:hypothetical protein n=1 Tax=Bradyrhizobium sp. 149 TaxID=2782624 RepID=UPI001FF95AA1|nr:hypothetical protein [Bradyrhizobium sp. 149]MCK1650100.1 hypothetical protein [Bradyrhizobium sp. 149]
MEEASVAGGYYERNSISCQPFRKIVRNKTATFESTFLRRDASLSPTPTPIGMT